jgi:hypothetical protein
MRGTINVWLWEKKELLLNIKRREINSCCNSWGWKKGRTIVDGINKKRLATIWDEQEHE